MKGCMQAEGVQSTVLRKISWDKWKEVTGGWRKLHNQ
jgi:hypothetical protein